MNALGAMVRLSGRPWWQARYADGRVVSEWDATPGVSRIGARPRAAIWGQSQWSEIRKAGMIGLRLLTPQGQAFELEARSPEGKPLDQRFIQIRQTALDVSTQGVNRTKRRLVFNLIGVVGDDGVAECRSYETEKHAYVADLSVFPAVCASCRLARAACGGRDVTMTTREVLHEWVPDPRRPMAVERSRETEIDYHGERHPVVAFTDSVFGMRYRNLGPLNLAVQGVRL